MSRIIGVTILLIILVNSFCSSSAAFNYKMNLDIRKCRCIQIFSGKFKCPKQLMPTNYKEEKDLKKCLCRKGKQQNRPELLEFCRVRGSATLL